MKVVVIGGGPAGMMAAITASKNGNEVYLLEKNDRLGKKLLITGKGRCNITSSLDIKDFIQNVPGNGRFLYSSFDNYTNLDIINFLKKHGVSVKEERGNRIFPTSDKSLDVLKAFETELKNKRVKIKFNTRVVGIETKENKVVSVMYEDGNGGQKKILADKVILATGGKTYSATGSTGDGYEIAQKLGHTIVPVKPSLVPLTAEGESLNICKQMQGLSLRNVQIKLIDTNKNKTIYEDFGEMLFTHFGVSGPTILSSSAHLLRYKNVENLLKEGKIQLVMQANTCNVPIISSMGAGNKMDPTAFEVADIYKTSVCPLAKVMRRELKKRGIKKLKVVYSKEKAMTPIEDMAISCKSNCICPPETARKCTQRRQVPGSNAFVPSVVGLIIAGEVIKDLTGM